MKNTRTLSKFVAVAVAAASCSVSGCGSDGDDHVYTGGDCEANGPVQQLIDRAKPGDVVTIPPGVHRESVVVNVPDLTLVGTADPADTVFDGCRTLGVGMLVTADRVSVRGMSFAHYTVTGLYFNGMTEVGDTTPLDGFEARGIAAWNNGLYGIYSFEAINGSIVDTYTSGHPDSGIYVGQCDDCNVLVQRAVAEYNAVGFEGTNSSGVWVVESTFRHNRIGITPNTQNTERRQHQNDDVIAGNLVVDNNQDPLSPEQASGGWGIGIAVGGGAGNLIVNNRVAGHANVGIALTILNSQAPAGNTVKDNTVTGNGVDLGWWVLGGMTSVVDCWTGNTFETSSPADLEAVTEAVCDGGAGGLADVPVLSYPPGGPGVKWRDAADPETSGKVRWDADAVSLWGVPDGWTAESFALPAEVTA